MNDRAGPDLTVNPGAAAAAAGPGLAVAVTNPYVGPRSFTRNEALYGRRRETLALADLVISRRIVLFYAPSGAGKTSLIQSALIPELERRHRFRISSVLRVNHVPEGVDASRVNRYVLSTLRDLEKGFNNAEAAESQQLTDAQLAGYTIAEYFEHRRKQIKPDDPAFAGELAVASLKLLACERYKDAESYLRECLTIRAKTEPDAWTTFNTQSMLGGALLGQKKYAEAEPLILQGYEGMKAREAKVPPPARERLTEAAQRIVQLYEAWGKPDQAAAWRAKLGIAPLPK